MKQSKKGSVGEGVRRGGGGLKFAKNKHIAAQIVLARKHNSPRLQWRPLGGEIKVLLFYCFMKTKEIARETSEPMF